MNKTWLLLFSLVLLGCQQDQYEWKTLEVTATAFNSVPYQTDDDPTVAAWGDTLVPGRKYIAVSRDLLALGLKRNTLVDIEGFEGLYEVKDKMNKRWKKRIDIYMGTDIKKAREWGRQKVVIRYRIKKEALE